MRVGFVADVHLSNHKRHGGEFVSGLNRRCLEGLAVFKASIERATALGCEHLVVLGDLFDTSRPEPQLLTAVQCILRDAIKSSGLSFTLLAGNHDLQSGSDGDHALGPLRPYARIVEHFEILMLNGRQPLICIPHCSLAMVEHVPRMLAACQPTRVPGIVAMHCGISKTWRSLPSCSIDVHTLSAACVAAGVPHVFAGDWHDARDWQGPVAIHQVGALVPTGWDNPGLDGYGQLMVHDITTGHAPGTPKSLRFEIPGPRFVKVTKCSDVDLAVSAARERGASLYLRADVESTELDITRSIVGVHLGRESVVAAEVNAGRESSDAIARTAALAARKGSTLDEALAAYMSTVPLDEGVDRVRVTSRVRGYLKLD